MSLTAYVGLRDAAQSFLDSTERAHCKREPPTALCQEGRNLRSSLQPVDAAMLDGYQKQADAQSMRERLDQAVAVLLKVMGFAAKFAGVP
jgi:GR25 family glycosyltransferase involved in LPS biosynthesis